MQKMYAKALIEVSSRDTKKSSEIVDRLVSHLTTTGRIKLLPKILHELRIQGEIARKRGAHVEVASMSEAEDALAQAATNGIHATKAVVNHYLVRGWRAQSDGVLVDHSAKQGLLDLYKGITAPRSIQ